jgi:hypothetical protein
MPSGSPPKRVTIRSPEQQRTGFQRNAVPESSHTITIKQSKGRSLGYYTRDRRSQEHDYQQPGTSTGGFTERTVQKAKKKSPQTGTSTGRQAGGLMSPGVTTNITGQVEQSHETDNATANASEHPFSTNYTRQKEEKRKARWQENRIQQGHNDHKNSRICETVFKPWLLQPRKN